MASSNAQRRKALIEANDCRRIVHEFKQEMKVAYVPGQPTKARARAIPQILLAAWTVEEDWERIGFMRVHQFLEVIPLFGPAKIRKACHNKGFGPRGLWPLRRLDSLTARERGLLASEIRGVAGVREERPRQPKLPRVVSERPLPRVRLERRVGTPFDQMVAGR